MIVGALILAVGLGLMAAALSLRALSLCKEPPQQRVVSDVLLEVGDLRHDVDALLTRGHKHARQENVAKAREVKEQRRSVVDEAAEVLARQGQLLPAPVAHPVSQSDALADLRAKAGLH